MRRFLALVAALSLALSPAAFAQSTGGGGGGGGSGTVTSVVCANATITSSGNCKTTAAAGTTGDALVSDGANGATDSGTLVSSLAPKASPTFTGTVTTPITGGGTQCLQVGNTGVLAGSGGSCGGGGSPGGSNTQLQYNNSSAFGGITDATSNGTTIALTGGTIDGMAIGGSTAAAGAFTTLSATGNLTTNVTGGGTQCAQVSNTGVLSGTGAACGGSGASGANPTASVGLSAVNGSAVTFLRSDGAPALSQSIAPTWTGLHTFNSAGAASTPSVTFTGTVFTGGSGTTTFPNVYINQGASGPTTWSTSGTELGVNAPSGFGGNFIDFHINGGGSFFSVASSGNATVAGTLTANSLQVSNTGQWLFTGRFIGTSPAAASFQFGAADAASAVAQTVSFQSSTTSGNAGANAVLQLSKGATSGIGGDLTIKATPTGTIGNVNALIVNHQGGVVLSQGFTVSTLPSTHVTGARAFVTDQLTTCAAAGAALTGGGSAICPVFDNGTAWVGD